MAYPYEHVASLREALGYLKDDCDVCPAWALCRLLYDLRCGRRGKCRHDIFPCGRKPAGAGDIDWAAIRRTLCLASRKARIRPQGKCLDCGKVISYDATRCRSCATKHYYAERRRP